MHVNRVRDWQTPPPDAEPCVDDDDEPAEMWFDAGDLERPTVERILSDSTWDETAHSCWIDLEAASGLRLGSMTLMTENPRLQQLRDRALEPNPALAKMLVGTELHGRDPESVRLLLLVPRLLLEEH